MLPGQLTVLIDIEEKRRFRKKKLQPSEIKKTDSKDSWEYYREDNRHTLMRCDLVLCQDEKLQMPLYLETVLGEILSKKYLYLSLVGFEKGFYQVTWDVI